MIPRLSAVAVDSLMCASINLAQSRHRLHARSRDEMERYVVECEKMTARDFYATPSDRDGIAASIDGHLGQSDRDGICSEQYRPRGAFPVRAGLVRPDCVYATRAHVRDLHRLSPLGFSLQ